MQPHILSYLNTGALLQTATTKGLDVAHSTVQVQPGAPSDLETIPVESHLPGCFEQSSTAQTQTLRDFEKHLHDLKKENFSLKLRIYFLEERMQQKYEASREDIYRRDIELKVEVESLKRELQEKQQALDKAWAAAEHLSSQNEVEICHQQNNEYGILEKKIYLLQEEAQSAKTKADEMTTLAEAEKERCKELRKQLMEFSKKQDETPQNQALLETCNITLAEKEKRIEELTWSLRDKEQLLELLTTEKQNLLQCLEEPQEKKVQNLCEDQQQLTHCDLSPGMQATELNKTELLEKIRCFDATNKQLLEKLNEMNFELKSVQHASQKQDHKIQNLKETLKSKENESKELYRVIEGQNETIVKLQDMLHRSQLGQLQISEGSSTLQEKQQIALLDLQNTLFCTQLEVQQLKRAQQQKERQMAEARRTTQFLETVLQEEQQQKEAAWQHNTELRAALQQLKTELQNKHWQCCTLEMEKWAEVQRQEQKTKHLSHNLAWSEQLLQETKELLQYHQNLDKSPTSADKMVQKLQQRIKDRDTAVERAVDEHFCVLEDREKELQKLHLSVKEQERDLEGLRKVLSSNQATIQGLESLWKAKGLELEQLLATYQNLKWLKEEMEAKSHRWQIEQERTVQQLQAALHDRGKEVEVLSTTLFCKLGPGQRNIVEELCLRLQQKEHIIKELLRDKSRQAVEQVAELQELLQAVSCREQQSHISSAKLAQALLERSCELQVLRQQLMGHTLQQKTDTSTAQLIKSDVALEAMKQENSGKNTTTMISKKGDIRSRKEKGVLETTARLEKELELLIQKERESRLELSALQSVVASQEEELQVQASDVESLTRNIQIKEEFIKDLQMQLVDPEEMSAIERLTQEVLMLREKVARVELQRQEATGNRRLQLLLILEGLATEKEQLNETLKAEQQLYSTLVKFHAHPDSSEQEQTLHLQLEEVQALRGQLEEALGRSLEHLSRLESLDGIGGLSVAEDAEDASTEFTDSIEEEAQQKVTHQQNIKGDADDSLVGRSSCPALLSAVMENSLQVELLSAKSEIQQVLEQKKKLEGELQDLKGQIEEAGFSSVSQLRKALLSLCQENAELKEQVGEAMLSEGWENEDEKEDEEDLRLEIRKLQEKLHTSEVVIGLLKEQLSLNSQGGEGSFSSQFTAQKMEQLQMVKQSTHQGLLHDKLSQWHCPPPQHVDSSSSHSPKGIQADTSLTASLQMGGNGLANGFWQQPHSELPQCRQQCYKPRGKLLVSEATIQAQMAQLDQYRALCSEPIVQQNNKKIQVDLQDLGYETCGRSENEADREEATSPECECQDEELKSWKKLLGSPPSRLVKHETLLDLSQCDDAAILRQNIQALQVQLQSSHRVIQNLQSHVCSISTSSNYASGGEHPLNLKQGYTMGSSPSQSMTEEDEGWHSDSLGSFSPRILQPNKALARLIQRVSLLEAHLGEAKPKLILPEELKPTASMGKYDSLVQVQARELSHLRQMMREGQGVCRMLSQHFRDTIKSFEELLRGTDVDYFFGQSFREQLAQGNQLAGRLARKLNTRTDLNMEDKSSHELLVLRLSKELQEKEQIIKTFQTKLQVRSVTPSSSHTMSESPRSGSSTSFSDGLESCSDMDDVNEFIYQEDPSEGQFHSSLGKDLDSRSGKASAQLSQPTSITSSPAVAAAAAPVESLQGNLALPSSQHPLQITSQASRGFHPDSLSKPTSSPLAPFDSEPCSFMPAGPPPPPPALAPLLGCCRTPVFSLAEAQQELQTLQKQLGESIKLPARSPMKPGSLAGFFSAGRPAISSKHCLQACHHAPQLLSLQKSADWKMKFEGGMGESRTPWSMPPLRQAPEQLISGILPSSSPAVLSRQEVSAADLLEQHLSEIQILRQRLEESICTSDYLREQLETCLALMAKNNGALKQDDLVLVDDGNKQRANVIGHLKNYSTYKKQSLEGKSLTHKMQSLLQPCLEPQGNKEQSMKEEIQVLRAQLAEQENRLQSASHVKKSMENVLLAHMTRTYAVLRKARTNLEGMSQQPTCISAIM